MCGEGERRVVIEDVWGGGRGREEGGDRGCVGRGEGERRVVIEDVWGGGRERGGW